MDSVACCCRVQLLKLFVVAALRKREGAGVNF